jgi:hypothetical protein
MTAELLRVCERFVGEITESDLEDLVFTLSLHENVYQEAVYDLDCDGRFLDSEGNVIDGVFVSDVTDVRWVAAGECQAGTTTA